GWGSIPATTSSPTLRALSSYLPTTCEPLFKAPARSPWRTQNRSRPSGTKRHSRRPGPLNTEPLGEALTPPEYQTRRAPACLEVVAKLVEQVRLLLAHLPGGRLICPSLKTI